MAKPKRPESDYGFDSINPAIGLNEEQVAYRKKQKQVNITKKAVSKTYGRILFDSFANPFNILLIAVTLVMVWGRLSFTNFVFVIIYGANIIIGIQQDIHARHLIDRLKETTDDHYKVIRGGQEISILSSEIVLSDIVQLEQGMMVPADMQVVSGHCSCDESLISGEFIPVKKTEGDTLYSGSFLKSGNCVAQAVRVGEDSYLEGLRKSASKFKRPKSEIAQVVWNITAICTLVSLSFGIIYTIILLVRHEIYPSDFFPEMTMSGTKFIEGLSGAMIAMLPTGMFLLTSVAMTTGVIALSKKNILVHELYCIENLARADVLCFDKTGTLTDGMMSISDVITFGDYSEAEIAFGVSAILSSTKDQNETARALAERFGKRNVAQVRSCVPFDPELKYSAVSLEEEGTYVIGAYGFVPGKDPEVEKVLEQYQSQGYRCMVVAHSDGHISSGKMPKKFEFCAVLVILDHIKADAKKNVEWFRENGVSIYVLSGDNPITVSEIARRCGIEGAERYIDMTGVADEDIPSLVSEYRVFGRVLPEQKEKIVLALQAAGHKVAMTGDGVNDVLALKVADCSIAMASGSSAAKSVAHLVCTKSDFSSLPDVVTHGRRVINNIERSCSLFLNKTVFAVLVSIAFLVAVSFKGYTYPFRPANMLVWEVFSIGIPSFFLALQPNSDRIGGSVIKGIFKKAIPLGVAEATCVLLAFIVLLVFPRWLTLDAEPGHAYNVTIALCITSFTLFSYVALFRLCQPLNKYRTTVFLGGLTFAIVIFLIDFFCRNERGEGVLLHFSWLGFYWSYPILLFSIVGIATGVYLLLRYFIEDRPAKRRKEQ